MNIRLRLAIVTSHPIQYYAPWFRHVASVKSLSSKVFYLWDFGVTSQVDQGFGHTVRWDVPLLDGYDHEFLPNRSRDPGTHRYRGLLNPSAVRDLQAWSPDAVLMFGYRYWTHLQILRSPSLSKVPILFRGDSHELCVRTDLRSRIARFLRRRLFRRFSGALAVGQANAEYLKQSGIAAERIFVAPHAVDNARFRLDSQTVEQSAREFRRELGIPEESFVIQFVGKLEEKKRPLDLLAAFSQLQKRCPRLNVSLLFVGAGIQKSLLDAEVVKSRISKVYFAPFQNQSLMPRTYAAGDLLVLPSYGSGETWGLVVNEAMNLSKPIVVSSHVGCGPDLVRLGQNGWIFDAGNVTQLADVLCEAASDRVNTVEYGSRSRLIVDNHSYEQTTAGLLAALQAIHVL